MLFLTWSRFFAPMDEWPFSGSPLTKERTTQNDFAVCSAFKLTRLWQLVTCANIPRVPSYHPLAPTLRQTIKPTDSAMSPLPQTFCVDIHGAKAVPIFSNAVSEKPTVKLCNPGFKVDMGPTQRQDRYTYVLAVWPRTTKCHVPGAE